eukprot:15637101-Heterocapsa_arctica.AAC.1
MQFDMSDYFRSACDIFVEQTDEKFKPASTRFASENMVEDLDLLLQTPGKHKQKAASYVMKLTNGARMAIPQIC